MDGLLSLTVQKVLDAVKKVRKCVFFLCRRPLYRLWQCCSWSSLKAVWMFAISPGPREVIFKSFAICLITNLASKKQIAAYLITMVFYNRFCLHSVSKAFKTYFSAWLPAVLPFNYPTAFVLTEFAVLSLLQINPEFSEIAETFIITFLSHIVLKVTVGCLVAFYSLLTVRQLDVSLVAEICSRLG